MKTLSFLLVFSLTTLLSKAQQNYFVYLQTDNKQTFYIKLNDQLYSSSASGYLVIPKLQNGLYNLSVGFPKAEWPEQVIALNINNKDEGFLLKNFNEKGWGLFNMQTLDVIMARPTGDNKTANSVTTNDGFSDVLAGVVNTPGLNVKVVEKSVPSVQDTVAVVKTQSVKPEIEQTSINTIRQLGKAVDKDGSTLVYLDKSGASSDTIHIFIANEPIPEPTIVKETVVEKSAIKDTSATNVVVTNPVDTTTKQPAKEPGFMAIELPNPNLLVDTAKKSPPMEEVNKEEIKKEEVLSIPKPETVNLPVTIRPKISIINSDCKQLATDEDFLKLRKKMASYDKDEDMITAARKNFKAKCFSTEQVKNLSVLFLTDAGKYQFFDVAYPFVHDSSSFASLQSQLTDSYYLNRFKAMVRQ